MDSRNIGKAAGIAAISAVAVSIMLNFELGWVEISTIAVTAAALIAVTLRLL